MHPTSKANIKNLLKKQGVQPSKGLGQNFLIDRGAAKKIIEAAGIVPNDIVLEIGPGLGALTVELAKKAKKVIAVEKDPKMIEILKKTPEELNNVEIIQGDILKIGNFLCSAKNLKANRKKLEIKNYKLVANLPFYLASPAIRKFLESENPPKEMILVVQKEVGQRICAKPPKMNLLAVSVQFYAKPKIISYISKKSFWPKPKVDSAIIKITPVSDKNRAFLKKISVLFFKIVKAGFSHPRKQLVNNFAKNSGTDKIIIRDWLLKSNIQSCQRAEGLTLEDWIKLTKNCKIRHKSRFAILN